LSRRQLAWLFFLPAVVVLGAVLAYPAGRTLWMSLHVIHLDEPFLGEPFVGLRNYVRVLQDTDFQSSLFVSAYFTAGAVILELLLGLTLAVVLNESFPGRGLMRAAVLVPWAIPTIVSASMWSWLYSPSVGAFNGLLNLLHIANGPVDMLGSATLAMPAMIIADVWKNTPFVALLLLAGLQVIPSELYEAARVDGASTRQRFRNITMPLLKGSVVLALLFRTLTAFQTFDLAIALTNGGPGNVTEVLSLHTYRILFEDSNFGQGSTLAALVAIICFALAALYARQLTIEPS
jgi:multiple sugar transport system permease protein